MSKALEDAVTAWKRALILLGERHSDAARSVAGATATVDVTGYRIVIGEHARWGRTIYDHLTVIRCVIREAFEELGYDVAANIRRAETWPQITIVVEDAAPEPPPPEITPAAPSPPFTPRGADRHLEPAPTLEEEAKAVGMSAAQIRKARIHIAASLLRDATVKLLDDPNAPPRCTATPAMLEHATREMTAILRSTTPARPELVHAAAAKIMRCVVLLADPKLRA